MMKHYTSFFKLQFAIVLSFLASSIFAIEPIVVTDNTFKLNGEEIIYLGLAEGDKIDFEFTETQGKAVKEVEIYSGRNTVFQDYKTTGVSGKSFTVPSKALYQFRFRNPIFGGRIIKVKITRTPASEATAKFDTGVHTVYVNDTTYTPYTEDSLVGYTEEHYTEYIRELTKTYYEERGLTNYENVELNRQLINANGTTQTLTFNMPYCTITSMKQEKIISWSIWIGVGDNSSSFWSKNKEVVKEIAEKAAATFSGPLSPVAALGAGLVVDLAIPDPNSVNSINYYILSAQNYTPFMNGQSVPVFFKGNGSGMATSFTQPHQLTNAVIYLKNPNKNKTKVDVHASAIVEVKVWEDVPYDRVTKTPQYVTLKKQKMNVTTSSYIQMNE